MKTTEVNKADKAECPNTDDVWGVTRHTADIDIDTFIHSGSFMSLIS